MNEMAETGGALLAALLIIWSLERLHSHYGRRSSRSPRSSPWLTRSSSSAPTSSESTSRPYQPASLGKLRVTTTRAEELRKGD